MNIKLRLGEVRLLIDKRIPLEQICVQLQPLAKQANLIFAEIQPGSGYLQWSLPGSDWISFSKADNVQKASVARDYKARKNQLQSLLKGSSLVDVVFSVPSEDFIYFRQGGEGWDIALTAWGCKYPEIPATKDLDTYITKQDLQTVNIGFAWAGEKLPELNFKLCGYLRVTSTDGFMHVDRPLSVGSSYSIETLMGHCFTLQVEQGKEDYVFDLTKFFEVDIEICQDGVPHPNKICELNFNGNVHTLTTDQSGHSQIRIPLVNDPNGQIADFQPPCVITCNGETQQKAPSIEGDVLHFTFSFKTEEEKGPDIEQKPLDPPISPLPEKKILVKIEVFRGESPVNGQDLKVLFGDKTQMVNTDEKGVASLDIVLKKTEDGAILEPQPSCEVICGEEHQTKIPKESDDCLYYRFDLPKVETPPQEPEFVYIELKDYAGDPLVDMPFKLKTKKKGSVSLQTDHDGRCKLPKDWFTPNEKMKIDFTVTSEYQQTHDIHYNGKKK